MATGRGSGVTTRLRSAQLKSDDTVKKRPTGPVGRSVRRMLFSDERIDNNSSGFAIQSQKKKNVKKTESSRRPAAKNHMKNSTTDDEGTAQTVSKQSSADLDDSNPSDKLVTNRTTLTTIHENQRAPTVTSDSFENIKQLSVQLIKIDPPDRSAGNGSTSTTIYEDRRNPTVSPKCLGKIKQSSATLLNTNLSEKPVGSCTTSSTNHKDQEAPTGPTDHFDNVEPSSVIVVDNDASDRPAGDSSTSTTIQEDQTTPTVFPGSLENIKQPSPALFNINSSDKPVEDCTTSTMSHEDQKTPIFLTNNLENIEQLLVAVGGGNPPDKPAGNSTMMTTVHEDYKAVSADSLMNAEPFSTAPFHSNSSSRFVEGRTMITTFREDHGAPTNPAVSLENAHQLSFALLNCNSFDRSTEDCTTSTTNHTDQRAPTVPADSLENIGPSFVSLANSPSRDMSVGNESTSTTIHEDQSPPGPPESSKNIELPAAALFNSDSSDTHPEHNPTSTMNHDQRTPAVSADNLQAVGPVSLALVNSGFPDRLAENRSTSTTMHKDQRPRVPFESLENIEQLSAMFISDSSERSAEDVITSTMNHDDKSASTIPADNLERVGQLSVTLTHDDKSNRPAEDSTMMPTIHEDRKDSTIFAASLEREKQLSTALFDIHASDAAIKDCSASSVYHEVGRVPTDSADNLKDIEQSSIAAIDSAPPDCLAGHSTTTSTIHENHIVSAVPVHSLESAKLLSPAQLNVDAHKDSTLYPSEHFVEYNLSKKSPRNENRRSLQEIIQVHYSDLTTEIEAQHPTEPQTIHDLMDSLDDPELNGYAGFSGMNENQSMEFENMQCISPHLIHHEEIVPSSSPECNSTPVTGRMKDDEMKLIESCDENKRENSDDQPHDLSNEDSNDDFFIIPQQQDYTVTSEQLNDTETDETEGTASETSLLHDKSGDLGMIRTVGAIDDEKQFAKSGSSKSKLNFCLYCKKMNSVISRHLETVHRDKSPVKKFSILQKGNPERRKIIETLRLRGNYIHNTDEKYNTNGELLVSRRPKEDRSGTEYRTCHHCKGWFSRKTIRRHFKLCIGSSSKHKRSNIVLSRRIEGRLHPDANERLVKVFSVLREDDIVRLVRYDKLLISFGNCLCDKYLKQQHDMMIRNRLRTLGRLLKVMKELDPTITDFKSIYHPKLHRTMIKAVKQLAGFDAETGELKVPSLVVSIGIYIKALGELLKLHSIENDDDNQQKLVEKYLFLHKSQYTISANRVALEEQAKKHRSLKKPLPTTDDIRKLSSYVTGERDKAYHSLQNKYSYEEWLKLAQYSLICIQVFNRRRAGEIERASISDLKQLEKADKDSNPDVYDQLTEDQKKDATLYSRFVITGKLGRDVPVLLDTMMEQSLSLLLQHRQAARVPAKNPYIFGLPGFEDGRFKHLRACDLMRQYSMQCGAVHPDRLRGTGLRKHMATACATQNVNENDIVDIANFMGHEEAIHRTHYRQSVVQRDMIGVSRLLRFAIGMDDNRIQPTNDNNGESEPPTHVSNVAQSTSTVPQGRQSRTHLARSVNCPKTSMIPGDEEGEEEMDEEGASEDDSDFDPQRTNSHNSQAGRIPPKRRVIQPLHTDTFDSDDSFDSPQKKSRKKSTQIDKRKNKFAGGNKKEKKIKKRWSQAEKDAANHVFGSMIQGGKLPSTYEIREFLSKNPFVQRTVDQMRTWASNQKKKCSMGHFE